MVVYRFDSQAQLGFHIRHAPSDLVKQTVSTIVPFIRMADGREVLMRFTLSKHLWEDIMHRSGNSRFINGGEPCLVSIVEG